MPLRTQEVMERVEGGQNMDLKNVKSAVVVGAGQTLVVRGVEYRILHQRSAKEMGHGKRESK